MLEKQLKIIKSILTLGNMPVEVVPKRCKNCNCDLPPVYNPPSGYGLGPTKPYPEVAPRPRQEEGENKVTNKQNSSKLSSIASRVLRTGRYNQEDVMSLAACVLSQDETKGNIKKVVKKKAKRKVAKKKTVVSPSSINLDYKLA